MKYKPHRTDRTELTHRCEAGKGNGLAFRKIVLAACLLCLLAASRSPGAAAEVSAQVTFTKEFPNSQPEYFSVTVRENGEVLYRIAPDDEAPLEFQLLPAQAGEIFSLARRLNLFREGNLESHRRVANMGKKTLAYQNGTQHYEATFNHTEVPQALALVALFEKISRTEQHLLRLEYLIRFDRLGVVKELLHLEADLNHGRLIGADQLVPLLERLQNDRSIVQLAQARASQIIAKIKSGQY